MLEQFQSIVQNVGQLRSNLATHNNRFIQRAIADHSKLLVEELGLDMFQQDATVRDDERNLVIAAAGSGKTRILIARIRYLLEQGFAPTAILAVTFTNKATEEMQDRLKQMGVAVCGFPDLAHNIGNRDLRFIHLKPQPLRPSTTIGLDCNYLRTSLVNRKCLHEKP
jgi:hypothetical protein